ncbi:hypothetical protein Q31b_35000 [Novipirellula aureliae]|uniref:Uncharacterized protein n=1 Tax=Novipirellula aureliae TaxID=2527966 RepID=A0A5C6DV00_9BACT|nr:hypothetical protein Q31b_35000 [Novipirellula aureliae]
MMQWIPIACCFSIQAMSKDSDGDCVAYVAVVANAAKRCARTARNLAAAATKPFVPTVWASARLVAIPIVNTA